MSNGHRVVILGGGFGGLNVARGLARSGADVTLIDRRNYHLFQPLLYQVATGSLSPGDISATLRPLFRKSSNVRVLMGEAEDIDFAERRVRLSDGEVPYDTLVIATGSEPSYFGNDEWETIAPPLKTVEDATEVRRRWLIAFEAAERETEPEARRAWLTFVIVGGGPTGVELAGALGEIANDSMKGDFRSIRPEEARIFLVEGAPRILPHFPEKLSASAERDLVELGVRTLTGYRVTALHAGGVEMTAPGGEPYSIDARTIIWAAGVRSSPLVRSLEQSGAEVERGRVIVAPDCSVPGRPEVFAIGDISHYAHELERPLPGLAPVAMQQGRYVAKVIRARIEGRAVPRPFRYFDKGNLATIGRGRAVGEIGSLQFDGLPAWLSWVFVHLMYLVGFQNRLLVLIQWAFFYITFNRRARLITGKSPLPFANPAEDESGDEIYDREQARG
jgi:NADH dehydrogenase